MFSQESSPGPSSHGPSWTCAFKPLFHNFGDLKGRNCIGKELILLIFTACAVPGSSQLGISAEEKLRRWFCCYRHFSIKKNAARDCSVLYCVHMGLFPHPDHGFFSLIFLSLLHHKAEWQERCTSGNSFHHQATAPPPAPSYSSLQARKGKIWWETTKGKPPSYSRGESSTQLLSDSSHWDPGGSRISWECWEPLE